jgi:hypothetical protein
MENQLLIRLGESKHRSKSKRRGGKMNLKDLQDKIKMAKDKVNEGAEKLLNEPLDNLVEVSKFLNWCEELDKKETDLWPYMEVIFSHYRSMADSNPDFRKGIGTVLGFMCTVISSKFPDDFHTLFVKLKELDNA